MTIQKLWHGVPMGLALQLGERFRDRITLRWQGHEFPSMKQPVRGACGVVNCARSAAFSISRFRGSP